MNNGRFNTFLNHLKQVIDESNPALILCVTRSAHGDFYRLIEEKLCVDRTGIFMNFIF